MDPIIRESINECFDTDRELLERWHIAAPASLITCVDRTMRDVGQFDDTFKFYPFYEESELAGYWGTEFGNYINLIFVKPTFRHADFMKRFWAKVQASLDSPFTTAVYSKNKPAIEFYEKLGERLREFEIAGNKVTVFKFNKDKV